ncbi:MAG: UDP-2,3-diacylglucosamine diphosphatase [Prevotella sp.]|nr:UDP-2,3-diacylglucosamine diphosphatase [Candidatus Equicola stercoris]
MMKNIYFISDAHLGSLATENGREQERLLVAFLDSIKDKAQAVYMLGDMFDFWYEYRHVVPKGFTRFLGKISELTDRGVEVHYFLGNHDIWAYSYLQDECGVVLHKAPVTTVINGKTFFLAHGEGLGETSRGFRFIQSVFHNKTCQILFSALHPRWGMSCGLNWAKHSRLKREDGHERPYMGEDKEYLVLWTKEHMAHHTGIDYYIFGHRHIELDLMLSKSVRMFILGDWISQFTYAVYDGKDVSLQTYQR